MPRPAFIPRPGYPYFKHQEEQDPLIRVSENAFRKWATGTGKTRSAYEDMAWNYANDLIDAAIVVAPVDVHERIWYTKQQHWLALPAGCARVLPYKAKSRCTSSEWKELLDFVNYDGFKVLVTYYEAISSASGYDYVKGFIEDTGRVMWTNDESHRIMTPGSNASVRMAKIRHKLTKRRNQTATPTANGLEDLYAQFRFLDPEILQCSTNAEFRGMFVSEVPIPNTHQKRVIGYRNVIWLNKRIAPYVHVAMEHPDLAKLRREPNEVPTSMSEEQWRHYKEMKTDYQTQLRNGVWVDAELSIVRLKRLQQIVAGHLPIPDPENERKTREVLPLDCPRIQTAIDTVAGCPKKVIVWAQEHYEIERLYREFNAAGIRSLMYYGKIKKGVQRNDILDQFEEDEAIKCLVANDAVGGTGLEIPGKVQPVQDMVYYSHTWSRLLRVQCDGRALRPGTTAEYMQCHDIVAPRTTDTRILARRQRKDDIAMLIDNPAEIAALLDDSIDYEIDLLTQPII